MNPITAIQPDNLVRLSSSQKAQRSLKTQSELTSTGTSRSLTVPVAASLLQHYQGVRFGQGSPPEVEVKEATGEKTTTVADDILNSLQETSKTKFEETKSVMSFKEFLNLVYEDPYKYLPTASSYIEKALESYGSKVENVLGTNIPVYEFTKTSWRPELQKNKTGVVGQEEAVHEFMETIKGFVENGAPNRVIVFVGPKGSGKSEIFRVAFDAVEQYSKKPEGARYTISWVFGDKSSGLRPIRGQMTEEEHQKWQDKLKDGKDSDMIPPDKVGAQLPSNLNIHPLFLLPVEARIKLLEDLKAKGKIKDSDNFDYFLKGKLDNYSQTILEGLLKLYKGDTNKAFRHVMVERWEMSKQNGKGLAVIPPSANRDAYLIPETADVDWSKLPAFLRSVGLVKEAGYLPNANGGMVNLDDMGREDPGRYLYLLITGETGEAIIGTPGAGVSTVREQLDLIFCASANPDSIFKMFKEGQWKALKDRFTIIPVPHLRRYQSEMELYKPYLVREEEKGRVVTPGVAEAFALWTTMSRLLPVNPEHQEYKKIEDESFKIGLKKLDPLRKALLYQGQDINSFEVGDKKRFTPLEQDRLRRHLSLIAKEHNYDVGKTEFSFYEGGHGLSARDGFDLMQKLVAAGNENTPLSILDVFEILYNETKSEMPYYAELGAMMSQMRQMNSEAPFSIESSSSRSSSDGPTVRSPRSLLIMVEDHMRRKLQFEIKQALGVYRDKGEYVGQLEKYIAHASAYTTHSTLNNVKLRSPLSSSEHPDPAFMQEMEKILADKPLKDESARNQFRSRVAGQQGKWDKKLSLEENITNLYGETLLKRLMAHDEAELKDTLDKLTQDLFEIWQNPNAFNHDPSRKDDVSKLKQALALLEAKGYTKDLIPQILDWAFDTNHISDGSYKRNRS